MLVVTIVNNDDMGAVTNISRALITRGTIFTAVAYCTTES